MIDLVAATGALAPEHRDVITTGGQIVLAILGLISVQLEANRRQTKKARRSADVAAEQTKTTGNGFAGEVRDELKFIRRELGGIRADGRAADARMDARMDRIDNKIDRHIEETR